MGTSPLFFLKQLERQWIRSPKRWIHQKRAFYAYRQLLRRSTQTPQQQVFVSLSSLPWNFPLFQRPHHIAQQLAQQPGVTILYLSPKPRQDGIKAGFRLQAERLFLLDNWPALFQALIQHSNPSALTVMLCSSAFTEISVESLTALKQRGITVLYEYIDEISPALYQPSRYQQILQRHQALTPECIDGFICTSRKQMADIRAQIRGAKLLLSQNACDISHFSTLQPDTPDDLAPILALGQPTIGYAGALSNWIDFSLIRETALRLPEAQFILIGAVFNHQAQATLEMMPGNVHYLGPKPYECLPGYVQRFTVAMIPFLCGPVAESTSPVKLFEYLAAGKLVVAPDCMLELHGAPGCYLAKRSSNLSDSFLQNLQKALTLASDPLSEEMSTLQANMTAFCQNNTWAERVRAIMSFIKS
jgi:hypothetical protein